MIKKKVAVTVLLCLLLASSASLFLHDVTAGGSHNSYTLTSNVDFLAPVFVNTSQVGWSNFFQTPVSPQLSSNSVNSLTVLNTTMDVNGATYTFQFWNITSGPADANGLYVDSNPTVSFNTAGTSVSFTMVITYSPEQPTTQSYIMTPDFMNGNQTTGVGVVSQPGPWAATIDFSQEVGQDNLTVLLTDDAQSHYIAVTLNPDSTFFVYYNNGTDNLIASSNSWMYPVRLSLYNDVLTVSWLDDQVTFQYYSTKAPVANFDLGRLSSKTIAGTVASNVTVTYGDAVGTPTPTPTPTSTIGDGIEPPGGPDFLPTASPAHYSQIVTPTPTVKGGLSWFGSACAFWNGLPNSGKAFVATVVVMFILTLGSMALGKSRQKKKSPSHN